MSKFEQQFEEYKLFIDDTQRLSERRQAATQTFLAVNTAIFTVLAFLVKDAGFKGWGLVLVSIPLFVVGALTCLLWFQLIERFRKLIGWRYEQLRAMEQVMPESESRRLISKEWEIYYKLKGQNEGFSFSRLEVWVPRLFFSLYIAYGVGVITTTALGWR